MTDVTQEEVNEFLDRLRESGDTNMFGAAPYIQSAYGLDRHTASDMLVEWIRTFSARHLQE